MSSIRTTTRVESRSPDVPLPTKSSSARSVMARTSARPPGSPFRPSARQSDCCSRSTTSRQPFDRPRRATARLVGWPEPPSPVEWRTRVVSALCVVPIDRRHFRVPCLTGNLAVPGPLAHPEEQRTFNPKVPGSRPGRPTRSEHISEVSTLTIRGQPPPMVSHVWLRHGDGVISQLSVDRSNSPTANSPTEEGRRLPAEVPGAQSTTANRKSAPGHSQAAC